MALSGSTSLAFTDYDSLKFSWTATQSVANNSSTVSWKLELVSGKYGLISSSAAKAYTIVVDGNTYTGTNYINIGNNTTKTLVSGSTVVKHNDDGSKTFNFSISQAIKIYFSEVYIGTKSFSGSGVLDDIPRYATLVNAPNFRNTSVPQVQYSNPLGESIEELKICIALDEAGTNIAVAWQDVPKTGIYYEVVISDLERLTLAKAVVGSTTIPIYYILSSTIGGVAQQSKLKCTYTIENGKPRLYYTVEDSNTTTAALTGDTSKFIKYYSILQYTFTPSGRYSATITSQSATYQGVSKTTSVGTFGTVESNTIVFSATDNRAQTTSETLTLDIIDYVKPTCDLKAENPTAAGNMSLTIKGNYFNSSFGATSNTLSVAYRIKEEGSSYGSWVTISGAIASGNTYEAATTVSGLDYQSSYTVEARIVDELTTAYSKELTVRSIPTFDWGKEDFNLNVPLNMNGNTVLRATDEKKVVLSAEGADIYLRPNGSITDEGQLRLTTTGEAYLDGSVEVDGEAMFNDNVSVRGVLTVGLYDMADFVVAQGTASMGDNGTWYWSKWLSGKAECYGTRSFGNLDISTAWGSMYQCPTEFSQSLPSGLFAAAPDFISMLPYKTSDGTFDVWRTGSNSTPSATSIGNFFFARPSAYKAYPATVCFHAIGRWK